MAFRKANSKSNGDKASHYFKTILKRKSALEVFAYPDSVTGSVFSKLYVSLLSL